MGERRETTGRIKALLLVLILAILAGVFVLFLLRRSSVTPPPASGDLNRSSAEMLSHKLTEISSTPKPESPKQVEMTQQEINSFLFFEMTPFYPKGVTDVRVSLRVQEISASAKVNFDEMRSNGPSNRNPLVKALFRGEHQVELSGRVDARNGIGRYEILNVRLDRNEIPKPLVDLLLQKSVLARYPEAGPNRDFKLPYGIERIEFLDGKLVVLRGLS
jgi:hypothetical protein